MNAKEAVEALTQLASKLDCACPIAASVAEKIRLRANHGVKKYGVNCARTDLSVYEWLVHAQEEAMDLAVYLERVKKELETISSTMEIIERLYQLAVQCQNSRLSMDPGKVIQELESIPVATLKIKRQEDWEDGECSCCGRVHPGHDCPEEPV